MHLELLQVAADPIGRGWTRTPVRLPETAGGSDKSRALDFGQALAGPSWGRCATGQCGPRSLLPGSGRSFLQVVPSPMAVSVVTRRSLLPSVSLAGNSPARKACSQLATPPIIPIAVLSYLILSYPILLHGHNLEQMPHRPAVPQLNTSSTPSGPDQTWRPDAESFVPRFSSRQSFGCDLRPRLDADLRSMGRALLSTGDPSFSRWGSFWI
ncbi:hypothetical protein PVAR5_1925 [Paecilomyces variotii No. 5]|uniref:Uncharacterized protein n=1 Tax=Byssochlamys spectabilis (strain No. 5 / NBRC 109023) TaxID=1356009 RepID=V5FXF8_BYSSN|nr:hypothetical protein PVAR5_1925 [Paecilomyces variotii No. 5]